MVIERTDLDPVNVSNISVFGGLDTGWIVMAELDELGDVADVVVGAVVAICAVILALCVNI